MNATALTLAVAQPATVPYDLTVNVAAHAAVVDQAKADVVVFPELSLTGYHFDVEPLDINDRRLLPLIETCNRTRTTALAGAPIRSGDGIGIAVVQIDGEQARSVYQKMHLGPAEMARFTAGPAPAVIETAGWRIGLAVCKDTGTVSHAAATAELGIDVYAAGVLEHIEDADVPGRRARRIAAEHRVWVAMASFAGATGEGYNQSAGGSAIWFPDGQVAAASGAAPGRFARFNLDPTIGPVPVQGPAVL